MTTVKHFDSTMVGAPSLSGTPAWGQLTDLLDALLINGFNLKAPSSITRDGTTATADFGTGHGFQRDQVIEVSGSDQAAYNGQFRVTGTTTNTVTFEVAGDPASPATGASISVKVAPLGFEIAFTGTNKRVYRSPNPAGHRRYLRVDNSLPSGYTTTWAKYARVTVAENMTDVDTFGPGARAPFDPANPTANEGTIGSGTTGYYGWFKWYHARNATTNDSGGDGGSQTRPWALIGDDRGFYLSTEVAGGSYWDGKTLYGFGDFDSYKAGDAYNTMLLAHQVYQTASAGWCYYARDYHGPFQTANYDGKACLRDYTQQGQYRRVRKFSINPSASYNYSGYSTEIPWPNPADYALIAHPVYMQEEFSNCFRGVMPGALWVLQREPHPHLTILENLTGYPGRKFIYWVFNGAGTSGTQGGVLFDITGPWR